MANSWYYEKDGAQRGPVPTEELQAILSRGEILPTNRVWTDGMQDWLPATQVPGLVHQASPAPGPYGSPSPYAPAPAPSYNPSNPYAPPMSGGMYQPFGGLERFPSVQRTNYLRMVGLICGGIALLVTGVVVGTAMRSEEAGIIIAMVGLGAMLWGWILSLIYVHRAWTVLQPHTTITTPGVAVGLLFIPFFNFYWTFVAYWRWSQEWNRLVGNGRIDAPRMNEGLFLTYAIVSACGIVAGALALVVATIIHLINMKQMCEAVNYAADRPLEGFAPGR